MGYINKAGNWSYNKHKLEPGATPKPQRIKAYLRGIGQLRRELEQAKNIRKSIVLKDSRTVEGYYEALAKMKLALVDLEKSIQIMENVL